MLPSELKQKYCGAFAASGISGKDQQERPHPSKGLQTRFPCTTHARRLVPGGFSMQGTPATSPDGHRVVTLTPFHSPGLLFGRASVFLLPGSSTPQMLPRSHILFPLPALPFLLLTLVAFCRQQPIEIRLVR